MPFDCVSGVVRGFGFDIWMPKKHCLSQQIMENAEINNIIKILGLQYKKNYSDPDSLKTLRYGKIMIMTDQVCQQSKSQKCSFHLKNKAHLIWKVDWFRSLTKYHLMSRSLLWQDQDGSHIKGLLINFIHHNWPALLKHNFLEEFITPIIKVLAPIRRLKQKDLLHFVSSSDLLDLCWPVCQEIMKSGLNFFFNSWHQIRLHMPATRFEC